MKTHLQQVERKASNGATYRIAFCGITDLMNPDNVLIVDQQKLNRPINRLLCTQCQRAAQNKREQ